MTVMVEVILDWDRLRLKCVRAKDMGDFGNIIATDTDSITLIQVGRQIQKKGKNNLSCCLYELAEMISILCNLFCISVDFNSMLLYVL
jgi:hypothetical protein